MLDELEALILVKDLDLFNNALLLASWWIRLDLACLAHDLEIVCCLHFLKGHITQSRYVWMK